MRPPSNATIGAWKLGAARTEPSEDAHVSFQLVGTTTAPAAPVPSDPISAARAWLASPERRALLSPSLIARAEASLLVAERYYRELDQLAHDLAVEAVSQDVGEWDPAGAERVDVMIDVLVDYSNKLRSLLDIEAPAPDADTRISAGLVASRAGGLPALVAAL